MKRIGYFREREVLTANRTYYVATTGSDSNDGLSSGTAFATIQKAVDTVAALDLSIYDVTIQVADGTYSNAVVLKSLVGAGTVYVQGNTTTPANVIVSSGASDAFSATSVVGSYHIRGFKVTTTGSASGIVANASSLVFSSMDFGAVGNRHVFATLNGAIKNAGNYAISGGGTSHAYAINGGHVEISNATITLSGTPAFSAGIGGFAAANNSGILLAYSLTFSGSATGKYYNATMNSVINTYGSGATYFPGNSSGTTATGGQYA